MIALSFWVNQFLIALIRFAYVKFSVEFHNRWPTQREKSALFFKLISVSWLPPFLFASLVQLSSVFLDTKSQWFKVCLRAETSSDKLDHGIRYIFLFFLPFTMTIFPTLYIYILLIRANNDRPVSLSNIAKGLRQRNRTNLLTARQSLNLVLIVTIVLTSTTFINVIYPTIQDQEPEIIILVSNLLQTSVLLIETKETIYSYKENHQN